MKVRRALRTVLVSIAFVANAGAYTPPTETGESGLMTIPTTATLPPGKIHIGAFVRRDIEGDQVFEPGLNGLRDTDLHQTSFVAGVGLLENPGIEMFVQVPYVVYQIDRPGEDSDPREIGNVRVGPKFRLFKEGDSLMPFGVAFMGSVALPTGDDAFPAPLDRNTLMNEELSWEAMAILDKELFRLPGDAPVVFSLNVGGLFPGDPDIIALEDQTEPVFAQLRRKGVNRVEVEDAVLQGGAGIQIPLWKDYIGQLDLLGEFRGNSGTIEEIDEYRAVLAALRYGIYNGLAIGGGVDFGLSNTLDRYNVLAGVSYTGPQPPPAMRGPAKTKVVYRDRVIEVERVLFSDINFEFDKATLTNVGRGQVYLVAQKLKQGKNVKIEIHGHTDYIGTEEYNKQLGLRRAETVKSELVKLGVDPTEISTVSFGEEKPLIDLKTPWARAVNRRAEFVVVGEPKTTVRGEETIPSSESDSDSDSSSDSE